MFSAPLGCSNSSPGTPSSLISQCHQLRRFPSGSVSKAGRNVQDILLSSQFLSQSINSLVITEYGIIVLL